MANPALKPKIILNAPQDVFINKLRTKFRAFVGGYGSGKTFVGCLDILNFFMLHPATRQGYFGPTYGSIRDIFYPTFEEAANLLGFTVQIMVSHKEVHVYRNGFYYGTVICRSMDNPASIVGFKISRAMVDEIDTLALDKATLVWRKIIARMRLVILGVENSIGVVTTPEGFMWVYETFGKSPTESYSMVQASTHENALYLPDDYIPSLLETYPPQYVDAYINGDFVNLKSGSVYYFDRQKHDSKEFYKNGEPIFIGADFNVRNMCWTLFVKREGVSHAIDEITAALDTNQCILIVKQRYPDSNIIVTPDASSKNTSSKGASISDVSIMRTAGFTVIKAKANPLIKDRVISVNAAFEKGKIKVNCDKCPNTALSLEQQIYDTNGIPEKNTETSIDDQNDGFGYFVYATYPVIRRIATAW